jgi:hypothetical protein
VRGLPQQQCAGVGGVAVTSSEARLRRARYIPVTLPFVPSHWSLSMLQPHCHCLTTAPTGESPSKSEWILLLLFVGRLSGQLVSPRFRASVSTSLTLDSQKSPRLILLRGSAQHRRQAALYICLACGPGRKADAHCRLILPNCSVSTRLGMIKGYQDSSLSCPILQLCFPSSLHMKI